MLVIAALTLISGIIVATVMYETLPAPQATIPVSESARRVEGKPTSRNTPQYDQE
jgi:hypothetical protein